MLGPLARARFLLGTGFAVGGHDRHSRIRLTSLRSPLQRSSSDPEDCRVARPLAWSAGPTMSEPTPSPAGGLVPPANPTPAAPAAAPAAAPMPAAAPAKPGGETTEERRGYLGQVVGGPVVLAG